MVAQMKKQASPVRMDAAALFKKLGLFPADERPILQGWREANARWRADRREKIVEHARRVQEDLRQLAETGANLTRPASTQGRCQPVCCVELKRQFRSLSEAARFVNRKASNISQAISRGGKCGAYHWEVIPSESTPR